MTAATPASPLRHLRARGEAGAERATYLELFFDLVYVFAVTQLSHLILDNLTVEGLVQAAFLLVVVWWAWIYTTWMTNWFDPNSPHVRAVLVGVMGASLLMAAALPHALEGHGLLFAASYVALQVGRNAAAAFLVRRHPRLRDVFERCLAWSVVSGVLWLAGGFADPDERLLFWAPALAVELLAPVARYWLPGRGSGATHEWDIDGRHFAERCHLFVIIALGESIVVTGATAAEAGLRAAVVAALGVAFVQTVLLWWLYFGSAAERSRVAMNSARDPGRIARNAYTYVHVVIVAGIIGTAAGADLLVAHPTQSLHGVALAALLGGPAVFLLGEALFQWSATGRASAGRLGTAGVMLGLGPLVGPGLPVLAVTTCITALLVGLTISELRRTKSAPPCRARVISPRQV